MTLSELVHIPLDKAYYCGNCHCVVNSSVSCPACADSSALVPLESLMIRMVAEKDEEKSHD